MSIADERKEHKHKKKIVEKEMLFDKLLEETRKNSLTRKNQSLKGWKKVLISQSNVVTIRCQANVGKGKKDIQCRRKAINNHLQCQTHGGRRSIAAKEVKTLKQSLGIYSGSGITALQSELKALESITDEQLQDTTDELKLGIALLRNYLKTVDDATIAKKPGQLLYIIGEIARLKKENYEMKHSKDVSFTREQVFFLFNQFYLILIRLIKDQDLLKAVSGEIESVGKYIGKEGFKEIS